MTSLTRACRRSGRTAARRRVESTATLAMIAAKSSAGNVLVSGRPPASEMTSGRSVIAIRSRIAEDFITRVRCANRLGVALEVAGGAPGGADPRRRAASSWSPVLAAHEAPPRHPPGPRRRAATGLRPFLPALGRRRCSPPATSASTSTGRTSRSSSRRSSCGARGGARRASLLLPRVAALPASVAVGHRPRRAAVRPARSTTATTPGGTGLVRGCSPPSRPRSSRASSSAACAPAAHGRTTPAPPPRSRSTPRPPRWSAAVASVLFPPLGLVVFGFLVALLVPQRRRAGEKYAGLRILR